jgi:hypothetical protein
VQNLASFNLLSKNIKIMKYRTISLPVFLYGCETWVFHIEVEIYAQNRVLTKISEPKRDKIIGEWRRQHNAELHNLCSSPTIIWIIESRRMRRKGHVAHMGVRRGTYRVSMGRSE